MPMSNSSHRNKTNCIYSHTPPASYQNNCSLYRTITQPNDHYLLGQLTTLVNYLFSSILWIFKPSSVVFRNNCSWGLFFGIQVQLLRPKFTVTKSRLTYTPRRFWRSKNSMRNAAKFRKIVTKFEFLHSVDLNAGQYSNKHFHQHIFRIVQCSLQELGFSLVSTIIYSNIQHLLILSYDTLT